MARAVLVPDITAQRNQKSNIQKTRHQAACPIPHLLLDLWRIIYDKKKKPEREFMLKISHSLKTESVARLSEDCLRMKAHVWGSLTH